MKKAVLQEIHDRVCGILVELDGITGSTPTEALYKALGRMDALAQSAHTLLCQEVVAKAAKDPFAEALKRLVGDEPLPFEE